ncbi:hypothetical protein CHS0354_017921 [Potamilus streckersoni]|uniref:Uncharacterized protein n=1 Tax=Potamilus streckersoni TaxID=2493646 RepID=A0AAE0VK77_9BIVA|nr:hypothetical protein CHS0354_017921 [Potamilus streckersoni]
MQRCLMCDEESCYITPIISNGVRHSSDCKNECRGAQREKTKHPQFSKESTRLATFVHGQYFPHHQTLASLGFYKGQGDSLCCYECGATIIGWREDNDPLLEHIHYSPECRYLATKIDATTLQDCKAQLQQKRPNQERHKATRDKLKITSFQEEINPLRSPEYSSYKVRLSTFARFPVIYGLDVHRIAAAGFYYTGDKDIVRCYACDGGLKQWKGSDNPWDEHYRWFPNCSYLNLSNYNPTRRKKKPETCFVTFVKSEKEQQARAREVYAQEVVARELNELSIEEKKREKMEVETVLNTPAALAALDRGYSRKAVKMAINELKRKGQTRLTADCILQVLISFEDKGIKLPLDNDRESTKVSSKNSSLEEPLTKKEIKKYMMSETRNIEWLYLGKSNGGVCHRLEEINNYP